MKSIKLFRIFSKKRKLIENLDWNFDQNFAETQNNFLHPEFSNQNLRQIGLGISLWPTQKEKVNFMRHHFVTS